MTGAHQADEPTVPCATCGAPTTSTGTKRCNRCWEVERRLRDYLLSGSPKSRAFVLEQLGQEEKERDRAADLWARLVTAWESADGSDDRDQDEFASAVATLVAEWQGFADGETKSAAAAPSDDDDSAFAFLAEQGLVDEYNAWCAAAPERAQREALFGAWQAELKAAQVAAGCAHPDGTICPNCMGHGNFAKWLAERKKAAVHYHRPDGRALCGSSETMHSTQPVNCNVCLAELRDAIAERNAAREQQAKKAAET